MHASAFCTTILRTEEIMRMKWASEVAQLVAEDNDQVRSLVRETQQIFLAPSKADGPLHENAKIILPLRKIRGSVHFAKKSESPPLQLADLCAFIIRGHLAGHPQNAPLYRRIRRALACSRRLSRATIKISSPYVSSRKIGHPFVVLPSGHLAEPKEQSS